MVTAARQTERFSDVELRTRRGWLLAPMFLPSLMSASRAVIGRHQGLTFSFVMLLFALLVFPAAVAYRKWPIRRRGELTVDGLALRIDGEVVFERRAIKQALIFPEGEGFVVRVTSRRLGVRDLRVETASEAERLLAALEQSEAQVTATFRCTYGGAIAQWRIFLGLIGTMIGGSIVSVFLATHGLPRTLVHLSVMVAPVAAIAYLLMRACKVTVGADGIAIKRPLRRGRFVPFSEVRDVQREKSDVVLSLAGDREARRALRLGAAAGNRRLLGTDAEAPLLALLKRIEDARNHAGGDALLPARALLARGSLTRKEWLRRVDQLGDEASSYRVSALPAAELWNVLADPRETAEVRAAAALAVRRTLDDAGRERVRIAASTIAEAPLRRIFTAVNAGDEATIDEALDELEQAEAPRPSGARASR